MSCSGLIETDDDDDDEWSDVDLSEAALVGLEMSWVGSVCRQHLSLLLVTAVMGEV